MRLDVVLEPRPLGDPIEERQGCLRVNIEGEQGRDMGRCDGGDQGSKCGVLRPVRGGDNRKELGNNRRWRSRWRGDRRDRLEEEEEAVGLILKRGGNNDGGGGCQGGRAGSGGR